jgi:uncharacterized protein YutE (UPF0331/DUF86 family)
MSIPIDIERLRERAMSLRENLRKISFYAEVPDEEFWDDERNILALKHLLLQAIEDAASICAHILARCGGGAPASYAGCFQELERLGILPSDLTERLMAMARFRNLLVHRYWNVDDRRVLSFARCDISDLEDFLRAVGESLRAEL